MIYFRDDIPDKKRDIMKAVIFDMDGTLIKNPVPFSEMRERIARRLNMPVESLQPLYESLLKLKNPDVMDILKEEEIERAKKSYPVDGLRNVLKYLRKMGIKIAIVTRNCREAVDVALGSYLKFFDLIITRDDTKLPKPAPDPILLIIKHFGISPSEAIVVGDYDYDIEAGRRAGCITVRIGEGDGDFNIKDIKILGSVIHFLLFVLSL